MTRDEAYEAAKSTISQILAANFSHADGMTGRLVADLILERIGYQIVPLVDAGEKEPRKFMTHADEALWAIGDAEEDKAAMYADFVERYKSSISSDDDAGEVRGWQQGAEAMRAAIVDRLQKEAVEHIQEHHVYDWTTSVWEGSQASEDFVSDRYELAEDLEKIPLPAAPGQPQDETAARCKVCGGSGYVGTLGGDAPADCPTCNKPDTISADEEDLTTVYMLGLHDGKKAAAKADTIPVPADVWKDAWMSLNLGLDNLHSRIIALSVEAKKTANPRAIIFHLLAMAEADRERVKKTVKALAAAKSLGVGS